MNLLLSAEQPVCADFLEKLAIAAVVISVEGEHFSFFAVNQLALDFYGLDSIPTGTVYSAENFQSRVSDRPDFPAYVERGLRNYRKVRDSGEAMETETDFTDQSGQVHWTQNFFTPLFSEGKVARILLTFTDVTDIKKHQEDLEHSLAVLANEVSEVCDECNRVSDQHGQWTIMKDYLNHQVYQPISHSICETCAYKFEL